MQKEAVVNYGPVNVTGLQKGLPCWSSGAVTTYPLSFVVVFRTPIRRLLGEYLEIHKEAQLRLFLERFIR
jgi:uncharacterized membrane protein YhdT